MDSTQLLVRVAAARGRGLKGDLHVSCSIEGQKQKTHSQHVAAVPSADMLGESTLSEEDARQHDIEYRWNDDLLFLVPSLKSGNLRLKLMSAGVMSKTCYGEASYDINNLDRAENSSVTAPKRKMTAAMRQKLQQQQQQQAHQETEPRQPTISIFQGWIKSEDKRIMFFVFISVTRSAGIPLSHSKKESHSLKGATRLAPPKCFVLLRRTAYVAGETIRGSLVYTKQSARDCVDNKPLMMVFHGNQIEFDSDNNVSRSSPLIRIGIPLWRLDQKKHDVSKPTDAAGTAASPMKSSALSPTKAKSADLANGVGKIRYDPGNYVFDFEINLPALMHPTFLIRTGHRIDSQLSYEITVFRPADPVTPVFVVPITIWPRVPYWAIHSPRPMMHGNSFHVDETHANSGLVIMKPSKYDKMKEVTSAKAGDSADEEDEDGLPVGPSKGDHTGDDPNANLRVAIILPKGYINMNDLEDITVIAVRRVPHVTRLISFVLNYLLDYQRIENECEEKFVYSASLSVDFFIEPLRIIKRPLCIFTMSADPVSLPEALPVRPGTKVDIPFTIAHDLLTAEKNSAMMAASARAAPLCTTAAAPLRAISCVLRLEVQTDPKLKGEPYRVWHPILFVPRYEPRALFKKFDQRLLPKDTPPIAARAIHRPDTTITIVPMLKSDSDPRYFIVPLSAAAPLYRDQDPPPDALAGRDFTLAPLVPSAPDSPAFSALAAPEGHPEAAKALRASSDSSGEAPKAPTISRKSLSRGSMAPPKITLPTEPQQQQQPQKLAQQSSSSSSTNLQLPATDLLIDLSTPRDSSNGEEEEEDEDDEIFASVVNPFAANQQQTTSSVVWKNPFLAESPRQSIDVSDDSESSTSSDDDNNSGKNWFDD